MSKRLLVLAWHNVEPSWFFHGRSPQAGRRGLERQLRMLQRYANVVPLRKALDDLVAKRPLPPRAVALTFDDGYRDQVTVAAPLLRAQGMSATFFLVRDFLSGDLEGWWEEVGWAFAHATAAELRWGERRHDTSSPRARRAAARSVVEALKNLDSCHRQEAIAELRGRLAPMGPPLGRLFMNWNEAEDLLHQGHDLGSHTCAHPILSHEEPIAQNRELVDSRRELEAQFQRSVDLLAYPNGRAGDYSQATLRLAQDAGYAFAVTCRPRLASPATAPGEVPRVVLTAEMDVRELLRKAGRRGGPAREECGHAHASALGPAHSEPSDGSGDRRRPTAAQSSELGRHGPPAGRAAPIS